MDQLLMIGFRNAALATVLCCAVAMIARGLARRPAIVHGLWLMVLLKLITPPLFDLPIPGRDLGFSIASSAPEHPRPRFMAEVGTARPQPGPAVPPAPDWTRWQWQALLVPCLAWAWLVGSTLVLVQAVLRIVRFQQVLRQAAPAPEHLRGQARTLAAWLGLKRAPQIKLVDYPLRPLLWAVGRHPVVILPRGLWERLDEHQQSMILAHELAHLRRGDHVVRMLELAVTVMYWWLPAVWWARAALRDSEEECCDAWVVWAFPDGARQYAEALVDTVEFLDQPRILKPLAASGFGRAHHLRRRLTMIMMGKTPRRLGWAGR